MFVCGGVTVLDVGGAGEQGASEDGAEEHPC